MGIKVDYTPFARLYVEAVAKFKRAASILQKHHGTRPPRAASIIANTETLHKCTNCDVLFFQILYLSLWLKEKVKADGMDPVMGEKRSLPTGNTATCGQNGLSDERTVRPCWIIRILANLRGRRASEQRREREPMIIGEVASPKVAAGDTRWLHAPDGPVTFYKDISPDDEEADAGFEELPSYSFASSHADPGLFFDLPPYSSLIHRNSRA